MKPSSFLLLPILALPFTSFAADVVKLPSGFPGTWRGYDRLEGKPQSDSVIVSDGFLATDEPFGDAEIEFTLRAPEGAEQVQAWAGFKVADQDRRYVVGLRGGVNDHIYLARYAPDADNEFLGIAPLDFEPKPGEWQTLRVVTSGKRILVFLNDEKLPRINVEDAGALWEEGGIALGGGYLPTEYKAPKVTPLSAARKGEIAKLKDEVWKAPGIDKEAKRKTDRATYEEVTVSKLSPDRTEISLDGNWLFMPEQSLKGEKPLALDVDDQGWHLLNVPDMWTPKLAWLHGETSFRLKGASQMKGVSDKAYLDEDARLKNYTFDWNQTKGGWYRHYVNLPADIAGRKVELEFDAIAKISEIWVNGEPVGGHVGMFGEVKCDISKAVKPGRNVIVVHVLRNLPKKEGVTDKIVGVAVTVEITEEMLKSLPKGMYGFDPGGIWQPVKLVVTNPVSVDDVFIKPQLDEATIDLELGNIDGSAQKVDVSYTIRAKKGGKALIENQTAGSVDVPANGREPFSFTTPKVSPELWSPSAPNLYDLEIQLSQGGKVLDRQSTTFGFRTFTVDGNRFLLNGQPYWLRGGNHFPIALQPNDAELAGKFIKLAREGNVEVTRTHVAPLTKAWAGEADKQGLMISFEGIWPWLMLNGGVPEKPLLDSWRTDFAELLRKYRNHPSVIMWTVNNEMKFYIFDREKPELMKEKWAVVSDMIKEMREIDPTRPIVADSGYMRKENQKDYNAIVKPNDFDDGDIDDAHRYYCWYNPTFMTLYNGGFAKNLFSPGRPLISQEMSSGYPRNDDGLPTRFYLFKHFTPQALVGKYAYENNDPAYFLGRQSFMTKQLAETIRREDHEHSAGILHFAYLTWFKDSFDKNSIEPFPTYYGIREALSPVLVSLELYGWHYYAGAKIQPRLAIVNDANDGKALPAGEVKWSIEVDGKMLAQGSAATPAVPHYTVHWATLDLAMPETLPAPRVEAVLKLELVAGGKTVSTNRYDLTLAEQAWATADLSPKAGDVALFDPAKTVSTTILPKSVETISSIGAIKNKRPRVLVVADAQSLTGTDISTIRDYATAGGRVLLLHPAAKITEFLPDLVKSYREEKGEIVSLNRPASRVFSGIEPLDINWFRFKDGERSYACSGLYRVNRDAPDIVELADFCQIHAYLQKPQDVLEFTGSPLVEAKVGKGIVLASELMLSAADNDPIAGRLLANMIGRLLE